MDAVAEGGLPVPSRRSKRVVLFAPDFTEVSTITRAHGFLDCGYDLTVFAFRRRRYNADYKPAWSQVDLGPARDGDYLRRAFALLRALGAAWRTRGLLRRADLLYARNIDQLMLAMASRLLLCPTAVLAYEVLDVAEPLTRRGMLGRALRMLERLGLRSIDLLVVSSPGFIRNYFEPIQRYRGPWFLLENKLHPAMLGGRQAKRPRCRELAEGYRWVIGYFGLIRGERTFRLMTCLAERFRDQILFYFRGVVTTLDEDHFFATLASHPNMVYGGPYVNPDDLPDLYSQIDFVWAIDLEHEHCNSRWLLPCRLYEGGLFAVPQLAPHEFEVGDRIEQLRTGWTFSPPYEESLGRFFAALTPEAYAETRRRLSELPAELFVSGREMTALCRLLDGGLLEHDPQEAGTLSAAPPVASAAAGAPGTLLSDRRSP